MSNRKLLEKELEIIVKDIIYWRDESCVERFKDGGNCSFGKQWGHVIPQGKSPWLRFDLGNVFIQCPAHNLIHYHGDPVYFLWYAETFGQDVLNLLWKDFKDHVGKKRTIQELEEILHKYRNLYQNRPVLYDTRTLINLGYYGEVIRAKWENSHLSY